MGVEVTPERLETLKSHYFAKGWSYEEGSIFHMFTNPSGDYAQDYHKVDGYRVGINPKIVIRLDVPK